MTQHNLFSPDQLKRIELLAHDGQAEYISDFYTTEESLDLFDHLYASLAWQQDEVMMFGKKIITSRKTCWVADSNCNYTYAGIKREPQAWTPTLLSIKEKIERSFNQVFNSCLLNLYHDGSEAMGWHRDNEKELDPRSLIASLSLGGLRKFAFRHLSQQSKVTLALENGSLLLMHPPIQEYWQHSLLKTKSDVPPRINLTFRKIIHHET